ncbi:MAG: hypothetical protein NTW83_02255 [Cyanobacteria bacterium]|nr:hypothetical protein [Cyanobacteriota bacterium]
MEVIRQQAVAHLDEAGGPIGNADGNNPAGLRGWLWEMNTPFLTVLEHGLSRSAAAARQNAWQYIRGGRGEQSLQRLQQAATGATAALLGARGAGPKSLLKNSASSAKIGQLPSC